MLDDQDDLQRNSSKNEYMSRMTANLGSHQGADVHQYTSYRERNQAYQGEYESKLTNKFKQTLAMVASPATPPSATRREDLITNQEQIPKMADANMM